MSDDISTAFAHPEARARASGERRSLDRISLRDHIVDVEIGAFQSERGTTQRVSFNIVVEVRAPSGDIADDVDRILSYDRVTEAIATELAAERLNLLETLAQRIADRILLEPQAERVFVRIEKLDRGPGALGVEIMRSRADHVPTPEPDAVVIPRVAFLSQEAVHSPHLPDWLSQLQDGDQAVVLCVDAPEEPTPVSGLAMTERRIQLLAIEQNAWVLASRDPRCVVVDSRTELDWAIKQGQVSVWAPSKIVLDAIDGPEAGSETPETLALWFAGQMQATELMMIGGEMPKSHAIALSWHDPRKGRL